MISPPMDSRTRRRRRSIASLVALGLSLIVAAHAAIDVRADISLSSRDTFAETNEGWQIGAAGIQPTQVSQPGPDGQSGYLSHFSDGGSANGKWLMWNDGARWQGNYAAAGVTGISLAATVSAGGSPVDMRVAFDGPGGWFFSSPLSIGAGWSTYSFSLSQSDFTHVAAGGGTGSFSDTMAAVTRFEVLSGADAVSYRSGGDILQAGTSTNTILIDDITAVPEPHAVLLSVAGLAALVAGLVRRRRGS